MFDFRYHALSLVAVFLALGIGIVLGVTIGDSLVTEAEKGVRASLRGDVVEARDEAQRLRAEAEQLDTFIEQAVPALVAGRLAGQEVAIVAFGALPEDVEAPVRGAVEAAGGEIDSRSVFESPIDERELGGAAGGRFARLGSDGGLLEELGLRIGRSIATGGTIAARLERRLDDRFKGDFDRPDAVVFYRREPEEKESDASRILEEAVVKGLRASGIPVVGVERASTDPSQIPFYDDRGMSSVDSVEAAAGRAALVFALGGAQGRFGFKEGAERPLPEAPPSG